MKEIKIKYRIYKFTNGNGKIWYRAKIKELFFYRWLTDKDDDNLGNNRMYLEWNKVQDAEAFCEEHAGIYKYRLGKEYITTEIVREVEY